MAVAEPVITLGVLGAADCELVRQWRNRAPESLRTPFLLTAEEQADFYRNVVCDRLSPHRYWAVRSGGGLVGMVGLTDIQWENGIAEISLILAPEHRGVGLGDAAVALILAEAFGRMRLATVLGECFTCNAALEFWKRMVEVHHGSAVNVPRRKFWDGRLWDSYWFTFTRETWDSSQSRVMRESEETSKGTGDSSLDPRARVRQIMQQLEEGARGRQEQLREEMRQLQEVITRSIVSGRTTG